MENEEMTNEEFWTSLNKNDRPDYLERDGVRFRVVEARTTKGGVYFGELGERNDTSIYVYDNGTAEINSWYLLDIDPEKALVPEFDVVTPSAMTDSLKRTLFYIDDNEYTFQDLRNIWEFKLPNKK